jgi:Fe-S-cluster containining protein
MLKIYSDLDEILAQAEDAEEPPPEPPGGIPKQWIPNWLRWPIRAFFLPFILLDLFAQKIARLAITPPYKKGGKCLKRGNCCHYILLPEAKGVLGKLFYLWNTQFLGFYRRYPEVHESEGKRVYVMGCRYLKKDGRCGHYHLRPAVCRKWPMIEYFGHPRMIKGCGFKAIPRQ